MKRGVLLISLILIAFSVLSQDVIYIEGLSSKKVEVLVYVKDSLLVYRDKSGIDHRIEAQHMHKVQAISMKHPDLVPQQTYFQLQLGLALGSDVGGNLYGNGEFRAAVNTRIFGLLQPGIGVGLDSYSNFKVIPIYLSAFGVSSDRVNAFFYNARIGFGNSIKSSNETGFDKIRGDYFSELEIGRRIKMPTNFITYSLGYKVQSIKKTNEFGRFTSTTTQQSKRITIKIGVGI